MTIVLTPPPEPAEVDLTETYDAIVVGSGAAGGMAAHVLTSHGLKVLLLEAGKKINVEAELRSMQWPYDHPRRGDAPPGWHALSLNEYNIRKPPYAAKNSAYKHVWSYVGGWGGSDYVKDILVDEKQNPYTGTNYAWVRARVLGGKTNIWGRLALRLSDYDFKAKTHDGYGEDWPISYADIEPYYDRVDTYLGISGHKEGLPHLPDSLFQRSHKMNASEIKLRKAIKPMGRVATPYRAGVTTDGVKNKYRSKCYGRGACGRRPGGCDIHAAFDSPTGLIYPAMDTGNLTLRTNSTAHEILVDKNTGKASGVASSTADEQGTRGEGEGGRRRGEHAGVGAAAPPLEVVAAPERHRQLEQPRRPQLLRAPHGTRRDGTREGARREGARQRGRAARVASTSRASAISRTSSPTSCAATASRAAAARDASPTAPTARLRQAVQEGSARLLRRVHQHGRLRRSAPALRERREHRPQRQGRWGIPVLKFDYKFGDNEKKMAADMAVTPRRCSRRRGSRSSASTRSCSPRAGRSTSSARRAWATIRRPPSSISSSSRTT